MGVWGDDIVVRVNRKLRRRMQATKLMCWTPLFSFILGPRYQRAVDPIWSSKRSLSASLSHELGFIDSRLNRSLSMVSKECCLEWESYKRSLQFTVYVVRNITMKTSNNSHHWEARMLWRKVPETGSTVGRSGEICLSFSSHAVFGTTPQ